MSTAFRGKKAESYLKARFAALSGSLADFDFERIPDAFSTRGAFTAPRTGDYLLFYKGANMCLEVKEVNHAYRLPVGNFGLDQRARMVKRSLAGALSIVAVYFKPLELWRVAPISYFGTKDTGSWDFTGVQTYSHDQLVAELLERMKAHVANNSK